MFIKIVYEHRIIDVIKDPRFVIWASKSCRFLPTDEMTANGVVSSDTAEVYRLLDKNDFVNCKRDYKSVSAVEINEDEYLYLVGIVKDNVVDENGEFMTVEQAIRNKIDEMSRVCENTIVSGFDIELSDGETHHFSLQLTDQINIAKLKDKVDDGEDFLPYHADNEPCKLFTVNDVLSINEQMEYIVEYNTTYFNSLKIYIQSMEDKNDIVNVTYGVEIPEEYQSDVLKALINSSNNGGD